ncbi:MAG: hypothetical protein HPY57_15525 [Ignavibacteria bacterium]|nr:hypothetical protein [Ignavibacteria bacterium]
MAKRWKWVRSILVNAGHYTTVSSLANVTILSIIGDEETGYLYWRDGSINYRARITDTSAEVIS